VHDPAFAVLSAASPASVRQGDMTITDQKIVETTPYTLSAEIGTGGGSPGLKTVWIV